MAQIYMKNFAGFCRKAREILKSDLQLFQIKFRKKSIKVINKKCFSQQLHRKRNYDDVQYKLGRYKLNMNDYQLALLGLFLTFKYTAIT